MTARYGVIGFPVSHSLSPLIFQTTFRELGMDAHYEAIEVEPGYLAEKIVQLRDAGWQGTNVTVPHKETILSLLDEVDSSAQRIGAVNTVRFHGEKIAGYNTDISGFSKSIHKHRARIQNACVGILGAGGSARAVAAALTAQFSPAEITIINRTPERAFRLCRDLGDPRIRTGSLSDRFDVVIQTTSVGMNSGELQIPAAMFVRQPLVIELIYHRSTAFLDAARSAGCETMNGLDMLIGQAADSFGIWTGKQMPVHAVRSVLEKRLSAS